MWSHPEVVLSALRRRFQRATVNNILADLPAEQLADILAIESREAAGGVAGKPPSRWTVCLEGSKSRRVLT